MQKKNVKKIIYFGLFGQHNLGNECTLKAIIHNALKFIPDVQMECICTGPEEASAIHKIPTFPITVAASAAKAGRGNIIIRLLRRIMIRFPAELLHWVKAFKTLKGAALLLAPGTGLLVDYSCGPFGYPYYVFKWSVLARLRRCRLLFVSVGAGPIYHPLSRWFVRIALSLADYRSYRDGFSKQYLESIGFNTNNDSVYPDLAFSLPEDIMQALKIGYRKNLEIGVGLIDYYGSSSIKHSWEREERYRDYINKVCAMVVWLVDNGYKVRILIGDVKYDSDVKRDVIASLEERGLTCTDPRLICEQILSFEDLLPQLAATDLVISPRFHNIILALMLNKPVVSISYNEKFDSLMADIGLAEFCHKIGSLDIPVLIDQFRRLAKDYESLKPHIRKKTEEYRAALDEQYSILFDNAKYRYMTIDEKHLSSQEARIHIRS